MLICLGSRRPSSRLWSSQRANLPNTCSSWKFTVCLISSPQRCMSYRQLYLNSRGGSYTSSTIGQNIARQAAKSCHRSVVPRAVVVPGVGEAGGQIWQQWRAAHVPAAVQQHPAVAISWVTDVDGGHLVGLASRLRTFINVQKSYKEVKTTLPYDVHVEQEK